MARPPGAIDLSAAKARLALYRERRAAGRARTDQDIRMDLREFNHARAAPARPV